MTCARREQISLGDTPFYHCISRCAFLCGYDRYTDRDYEHRRGWIRAKMVELVEIFAIDVYAYGIMSNHYHVVLEVDAQRAAAWSDDGKSGKSSNLLFHVSILPHCCTKKLTY